MRRLVVVLALCAGTGVLSLAACGGEEKPPLTPDSVETTPPEAHEAGAPPATSAGPPK